MPGIENRPFDALQVGEEEGLVHVLIMPSPGSTFAPAEPILEGHGERLVPWAAVQLAGVSQNCRALRTFSLTAAA